MEVAAPQAAVPVIELVGVSKRFGAIQALKEVDLSLYAGEVHALVGENGAGKSTLVKILAGVHRPDRGLLKISGEAVELRSPAQAQAAGIAVIHQEPTLFPDLDVAENVFMGHQPRDRLGRIDWRRMYREVEQLLQSLGVELNVYLPVRGLSVADRQLVEIARALSQDARVLIMDEPTASLSPREVEELFTIVEQLRARQVAILFVSHRLEEVFRLASRVTVLRDGQRVITAPAQDLTPEETVRHMVGRELAALFPKEEAAVGEVVLEVRHLSRAGLFRDVSFQLRRGEILGLAGLVGAGRTEVARVLFGIDQAESGEILVDGRPVSIRSPRDAMRYGIAYVPEDRHQQGLVLDFSIARNITLSILKRVARFSLIRSRQELKIAADYAERLHVRGGRLTQPVRALSGGNQQKVVLGKWLATEPRILILDEPTRGIDIGAKAEVHRIVSELAARGLAILLISSELPEILAMSDRVLVMHEGRISGLFSRAEADQEKVMLAATGQNRQSR
jgi:rhamnose transport system ATP-binding protein